MNPLCTRGSRWVRDANWWAAVVGGAIGFPIAVLLHELAHFGAYAAFGFPDPVLSHSSAGWSGDGEFARLFRAGDVEAAAAIVEPWQEAVGAAAGPIVSYLIIIGCVLAVRRFGPGPLCLVFAIGLVTPFRWTWPWGPVGVVAGAAGSSVKTVDPSSCGTVRPSASAR